MRSGIKDAELRRMTALVRGGATWEEARATVRNVDPKVLERFKLLVLEEAKDPGPAEQLPTPPSPEELAQAEAAFKESLFAKRGRPSTITKRTLGR